MYLHVDRDAKQLEEIVLKEKVSQESEWSILSLVVNVFQNVCFIHFQASVTKAVQKSTKIKVYCHCCIYLERI
jgi:hypothetical protein